MPVFCQAFYSTRLFIQPFSVRSRLLCRPQYGLRDICRFCHPQYELGTFGGSAARSAERLRLSGCRCPNSPQAYASGRYRREPRSLDLGHLDGMRSLWSAATCRRFGRARSAPREREDTSRNDAGRTSASDCQQGIDPDRQFEFGTSGTFANQISPDATPRVTETGSRPL